MLSKTQLNFCKLCPSEKFYILKSLNDPYLLNKQSELVNICRYQSKLILASFKKNRYSEWNDTMDWYLNFDISSSVFDVFVCCNTFCGILTYSPFHNFESHTVVVSYLSHILSITTKKLIEASLESWPERDFNRSPLNSVQTL